MGVGSKIGFWLLALLVFGQAVFFAYYAFRHENDTVFWIAEGAAGLSILFFVLLYRRLVRPYQILQSGMKLLNEQDFTVRLRPVRNSAANRVIGVFNRMIAQLKKERTEIREKNRFLDLLISASPQGVIVLDLDGMISEVNPAALKLLEIADPGLIVGKEPGQTNNVLLRSLASLQKAEEKVVRTADRSIYRCVRSSFVDRSFDRSFFLVEELTNELRKMEKESYERIIRTLSHEVNNSMGAVGSSLHVVSEVLRQENDPEREDILAAVEASLHRCDRLAGFIDNFARVVRIPEPDLSAVPLNEIVRSVDALTRSECARRGIVLDLLADPADPVVRIDGILFEQVLVNLIKNAYESIGRNGTIRIVTAVDPVSVTVEDDGPGIPESVRERLFTPFFTTKKQGQGIGLMFVREVLDKHGCRFDLSSSGGKTSFRIFFTK